MPGSNKPSRFDERDTGLLAKALQGEIPQGVGSTMGLIERVEVREPGAEDDLWVGLKDGFLIHFYVLVRNAGGLLHKFLVFHENHRKHYSDYFEWRAVQESSDPREWDYAFDEGLFKRENWADDGNEYELPHGWLAWMVNSYCKS